MSALGGGIADPLEPVLIDEGRKDIDVISFSGDKLLGGPQAGIILGKNEIIGPIRRNPLTRALRPDKFTLAALEATLLLYLDPRAANREIPILHMLSLDEGKLGKRARRIARVLRRGAVDAEIQVVKLYSEVGGGSLPDVYLPSCGLSVRPSRISVDALDRNLRSLDVPVIGRIEKERFLIDMRTIRNGDEHDLTVGLRMALKDGR